MSATHTLAIMHDGRHIITRSSYPAYILEFKGNDGIIIAMLDKVEGKGSEMVLARVLRETGDWYASMVDTENGWINITESPAPIDGQRIDILIDGMSYSDGVYDADNNTVLFERIGMAFDILDWDAWRLHGE